MSVTSVRRSTFVLALLVLTQFLSGCGGSGSLGGGGGGQPPPPPSNPIPAITSLNPSSANAGEAAFTVTITGYNFLSSSSAQWNGGARTTTYISSTQLQVQITAADIANPGSETVSVTNPSPGGGNSGSAEFTIDPTSNPAPTTLSISPTAVNAGSSEIILTVYGSNFMPTSTIQWNGAALTTSYLSSEQLEAQVPASSLASPGVAGVAVLNPSPGGGASTPLLFAINYQPLVVNQLANGMVWDPINQVIYLSVPSLASSLTSSLALSDGNTIATLDPTSGSIQSTQFAGSEPDVLAISDDSQYLYAGLDGSSSVQRFTLPSVLPDINYTLGAGPYPGGPYYAAYLQAAPGLPHTAAVSPGVLVAGAGGGSEVMIFDDATQRPATGSALGASYNFLQWGSDAQIYAINNQTSSFDFYVLRVDPAGSHLSHDYLNEFSDFYVGLHYDSGTGYAYTDDGYVINPANGQHVGQFQASGYMVPDSTLNSAFFLGQTQSQAGSTSFAIASFDLTTFAPVAEITIPDVQGNPLQFIRWGENGLAFNDDAGFVYIINSSSFVSGSAAKQATRRNFFPVTRNWPNPVIRSRQRTQPEVRSQPKLKTRRLAAGAQESNAAPTIATLNPSSVVAGAAGLGGFTLTVTGNNFVSLSTVEWSGSPRQTELVSSTELQALINFSDVQNAGTATVTVSTPSPGGGTSSGLTFTIVNQPGLPPIPSIIALNPNSAMEGSGGLLVDLSGVWLSNSDTVDWNGSPRTNSSQGFLAAQVNASDLTTPGYAQVTVVTPGGMVSNVAEFQILYQPTAVNQSANDMVWDPVNQVFYISVPSSAATNANQVCVLNPATNAISNCQAGNEPDVLAISDDSQFLYVGMDGAGSVQRFVLPSLSPDISYSLGNYGPGAPYFALDLQVAPGAPHTTAVSKGANVDPAAQGGVTIYDDSTPRANSTVGCGSPLGQCADSIQWGSDDTEIYAANTETTSFDFYTFSVNSSGIALQQDYPSVFWNPGRIHYDAGNGLIYSDDGFHAINPITGLPVGIFEVGGGSPMAPDSSLNSVFILAQYIWQENSNFTIDIFDMTHYVRKGWVPFPTTASPGVNPLGRFIRWGSNGLAVNFKGDQIYLLSGSFVNSQKKSRAIRYEKPTGTR